MEVDYHADLHRARSALAEAELTDDVVERHRRAQLAALRVAAVVLALRTRPARHPGRPRNAWQLLAQVAPEYAEWAGYFHAIQGRTAVSSRESDDLVRDAETFLGLVQRRLDRSVGRPWARSATHVRRVSHG